MEKTQDEIKASVLAYCTQVCPIDDMEFSFENQGMQCTIIGSHHHGIADFDIRETGTFQRRIYQIRSSDYGSWWNLYYIFLGLAARDAVEAERARLTQVPTQTYDEFKANLAKAVKDDDFPMADMYVQCLQVQLLSAYTNLESRAAALVEALEEIEQMASGQGEWRKNTIRAIAGRAIEAHKKGATNV